MYTSVSDSYTVVRLTSSGDELVAEPCSGSLTCTGNGSFGSYTFEGSMVTINGDNSITFEADTGAISFSTSRDTVFYIDTIPIGGTSSDSTIEYGDGSWNCELSDSCTLSTDSYSFSVSSGTIVLKLFINQKVSGTEVEYYDTYQVVYDYDSSTNSWLNTTLTDLSTGSYTYIGSNESFYEGGFTMGLDPAVSNTVEVVSGGVYQQFYSYFDMVVNSTTYSVTGDYITLIREGDIATLGVGTVYLDEGESIICEGKEVKAVTVTDAEVPDEAYYMDGKIIMTLSPSDTMSFGGVTLVNPTDSSTLLFNADCTSISADIDADGEYETVSAEAVVLPDSFTDDLSFTLAPGTAMALYLYDDTSYGTIPTDSDPSSHFICPSGHESFSGSISYDMTLLAATSGSIVLPESATMTFGNLCVTSSSDLVVFDLSVVDSLQTMNVTMPAADDSIDIWVSNSANKVELSRADLDTDATQLEITQSLGITLKAGNVGEYVDSGSELASQPITILGTEYTPTGSSEPYATVFEVSDSKVCLSSGAVLLDDGESIYISDTLFECVTGTILVQNDTSGYPVTIATGQELKIGGTSYSNSNIASVTGTYNGGMLTLTSGTVTAGAGSKVGINSLDFSMDYLTCVSGTMDVSFSDMSFSTPVGGQVTYGDSLMSFTAVGMLVTVTYQRGSSAYYPLISGGDVTISGSSTADTSFRTSDGGALFSLMDGKSATITPGTAPVLTAGAVAVPAILQSSTGEDVVGSIVYRNGGKDWTVTNNSTDSDLTADLTEGSVQVIAESLSETLFSLDGTDYDVFAVSDSVSLTPSSDGSLVLNSGTINQLSTFYITLASGIAVEAGSTVVIGGDGSITMDAGSSFTARANGVEAFTFTASAAAVLSIDGNAGITIIESASAEGTVVVSSKMSFTRSGKKYSSTTNGTMLEVQSGSVELKAGQVTFTGGDLAVTDDLTFSGTATVSYDGSSTNITLSAGDSCTVNYASSSSTYTAVGSSIAGTVLDTGVLSIASGSFSMTDGNVSVAGFSVTGDATVTVNSGTSTASLGISIPSGSTVSVSKGDGAASIISDSASSYSFDGSNLTYSSGSGSLTVSDSVCLKYGSGTCTADGECSYTIDDQKVVLESGSIEMSGFSIYTGDILVEGTAAVSCSNSSYAISVEGANEIQITVSGEVQKYASLEGKSFDAVLSASGMELTTGTVVLDDSRISCGDIVFGGDGTFAYDGTSRSISVTGTDVMSISAGDVVQTYSSIAGGSFTAYVSEDGWFALASGTVLIPEGSSMESGDTAVIRSSGNVYLKSDGTFILGSSSEAKLASAGASSTSEYTVKNSSATDVILDAADTEVVLESFYADVETLREQVKSDTTGADLTQVLSDLDSLVYDASLTLEQNQALLSDIKGDYEEAVYGDQIARFEAYKAKITAGLDALHKDGESVSAYSIIETAKNTVSNIYFNRNLGYQENQARLDPYLPDVISAKIGDNDEQQFATYKEQVIETIQALHQGETCRGEKAVIDDAYNQATALAYSESLSPLENQEVLDEILEACNTALEGYRSSDNAFDIYVESNISYLETQDTFGSSEAAALVESYKKTLGSMMYISSQSIDSNLARVDSAMDSFEKALNAIAVREFTAYKEAKQTYLSGLADSYYEPEVKAAISEAQSELSSCYYLSGSSYSNSTSRIDDVLSSLESTIGLVQQGNQDKFDAYRDSYLEQFDDALSRYSVEQGGLTEEERLKIVEAIESATASMGALTYDHSASLITNKAAADEIATGLSSKIYEISSEDDLKTVADEYARALQYVSGKVISGSTDKIDELVEQTKLRIETVYDNTDLYDIEDLSKLKPAIDAIISEFDASLDVLVETADYDRVVDAAVDYLEERYSGYDDATAAKLAQCIESLRAREMDPDMDLSANQAAIEEMTNGFSIELFKLRLSSVEGEFESYRDYLLWSLNNMDESTMTESESALVDDCKAKLKAVQFAEGSLLYNKQKLDSVYNDFLTQYDILDQQDLSGKFDVQKGLVLEAVSGHVADQDILALLNAVVYDPGYSYDENIRGLEYLEAAVLGNDVSAYKAEFTAHLDGIVMKIRAQSLCDQSDETKDYILAYLDDAVHMAFDGGISYLGNFGKADALYEEFAAGLKEHRYLDNSAVVGNLNADGTLITGGDAEYPDGETAVWGIVAGDEGLGDNASVSFERTEVPEGAFDADTYAAEGSNVTVLSEGNVLGAFEITLMNNGTKVTEFNGTYRIMILLPEDMRGYGSMQVVYPDEFGKLQVYEAEVVGNYLVFYTTHFSTFYLVGLTESHPEYDIYVYIAVVLAVLLVFVYLLRIVRFDANGGAGEMSSVIYLGNGDGGMPACGFTREGYRFAGWSRDASASESMIPDKAAYSSIGRFHSARLYAVWICDKERER